VKYKEREILKAINDYNEKYAVDDMLKEVHFEYCRFDAYNVNHIAEIKDRNSHYEDVLIEFDKYAFNKEYAKIRNKNFIYIVGVKNKIYIFNVTELDRQDYEYRWEWKILPKYTEFDKGGDKIHKFVGYININQAFVIDKE
jgi:hypothetical protein